MKKKLTVDFTGFWPNFLKKDNYFFHLLNTKYEVEIKYNNPDILFYSADYSKKLEHLNSNYDNSVKIFYTGENINPDFNICDASFSFDTTYSDKNYRLPLWVLHINWFEVPHVNNRDQSYLIDKELLLNRKKIAKPNKKFCSFVASNPSGERMNFVPLLNKIKNIDSRGRILNDSNKRIKGRGDQKWKIKFLSKYRFNISFENEISKGYVTEKIIQPMAVNSLPIYWGSKQVLNDFNEDSFVFVNKFDSFESSVEYIMDLENNQEKYLEKLNKPWFSNNEFPKFSQPENVLNFIESVLFK